MRKDKIWLVFLRIGTLKLFRKNLAIETTVIIHRD